MVAEERSTKDRVLGLDRKWGVFAVASGGTLMATIDASTVSVALPRIGQAFGAPMTSVGWVSVAYLVTTTGLLLTFGRLADIHGRRALYLIGLAVFTLGSASCAVAWGLAPLIVARVFQAAGGAMLSATNAALITQAFPPDQRGRALGLSSAVVAAGLTLGPTIGGLLMGLFSWRAVFLANLPLGLIVLLLAARSLPDDAPPDGTRHFDYAGAVLLLGLLVSTNLVLTHGGAGGWRSPGTYWLIAACAVAASAFMIVESRARHPLIELSLFRNRLFTATSLTAFFAYWVMYTNTLLLPFYLLDLRAFSPQRAGLILTTVPILSLLVSPLSGWLSDRIGAVVPSSLGLAMVGVSMGLLSGLGEQATSAEIVVRLALYGVGYGLFLAPNTSALMGSVRSDRLGIAAAMVSLMRVMGMTIGMSVAGSVFASQTRRLTEALLPPAASFAGAFRAAYVVAVAVCGIAVLASLVRGKDEEGRMKARSAG